MERKGICKNVGICASVGKVQVITDDEAEFVCPECGEPLEPYKEGTKKTSSSDSGKKLAFGIIAGIVIVLAIIGGIIAFGGRGEVTPNQEPVAVAPVDSDSIRAAQLAEKQLADQKRVQDSLQAVADSLAHVAEESTNAQKQEAPAAKPTTAPAPKPAASGSKNLGYATFKGTWPNDVNGRMVFNSSHVIDSRDPKGRVAEPGDYVIGEWSDGHLVQGIWYGADNQVKGSIIIGK